MNDTETSFISTMAQLCEHRAKRAVEFFDLGDYETGTMYELKAERAAELAFDTALRAVA